MKVFRFCLLAVLLTGAALLRADDTLTPEATAYAKVRTAMATKPPADFKPGETKPEDIVKWQNSVRTEVLAAADAYLKDFPDGEKNVEVKFLKARNLTDLGTAEKDKEKTEQGKSLMRDLAKQDIKDTNLAFAVHASFLLQSKTPEEFAAEYEVIQKQFADNPKLSRVLYSAMMKYKSEGDIAGARNAAKTLIDKFPNDPVAAQAQGALKQLDIIGKPMELSFTAQDGKEINLKNYRGKVVLVDFWATWCGPCVAELPNVQKTYEAFHDKGFEVVGISLDQSKEKLTDFIADRKIPWPQYFDGKGWKNDISTKFGIQSIPATFLVDKEGNVARMDVRGEALPKAVAELLK